MPKTQWMVSSGKHSVRDMLREAEIFSISRETMLL